MLHCCLHVRTRLQAATAACAMLCYASQSHYNAALHTIEDDAGKHHLFL